MTPDRRRDAALVVCGHATDTDDARMLLTRLGLLVDGRLDWPEPVRRQSNHFSDFARALEKLNSIGVLYRCFLTRREIAEQAMSAPRRAG